MAGELIQSLGGDGYINDYPTGRLWRDAKLYKIRRARRNSALADRQRAIRGDEVSEPRRSRRRV